jgi:hypothetical protein
MPKVEQERLLVAPGTAGSLRVTAGTQLSVVDVEGGQVGDLFAFNAHDTTEFASAPHTRLIIEKLFPVEGDAIYSNLRNAMLTVERDSSPRRHDTLYAACDPRRYEMLGVGGSHRSCATNLAEAMNEHGGLKVPTPQPFNLFMEVSVDAAGNTAVSPATSAAGDHILFRAVMDVILVLSSCPMDIKQISTGGITQLAIEVL